MGLYEYVVEGAALTCFGEVGYAIGHAPRLSAGSSPNLKGTSSNLSISSPNLREVLA